MKAIYLVGTYWYSADQGDWPNVQAVPEFLFEKLEDAEAKYEELAKTDSSWGFGWSTAYLVEASPDGFKELKGYWKR